MEIKAIGVLGAGSMGNGIAQVAAQAGYQVVMRDIEDRFVETGCQHLVVPFQHRALDDVGLLQHQLHGGGIILD